jgi:putative hemolysin
MRKLLLIIVAVVLSSAVFGQAKKPTIMVVPSDQYCISKGYKLEFDDMGTKKVLPDYKAAFKMIATYVL